MELWSVAVQEAAQARLLQPGQRFLEVGACNEVRLHSPVLVRQHPLPAVLVTEVAAEAHSPLGIDPLQTAPEVDLHLLTGARS
jgi:hypothetical protein